MANDAEYRLMSAAEIREVAPEHIAVGLKDMNYRTCSIPQDMPYEERIDILKGFKIFGNIKRRQYIKDGRVYYLYPDE